MKARSKSIGFIFGFIFIAMGVAPLILALTHWEAFVESVPMIPFILGGMILFIVAGLAVIIFSLIRIKLENNIILARESISDDKALFIAIEKERRFAHIETLCMCLPVPFVLLLAFLYLLTYCKQEDKLTPSMTVVLYLCIGFLLYIALAIPIGFILKAKQGIKINGTLTKIVLTSNVTVYDNVVSVDSYRLLIEYEFEGKKYEYLSHETYSKEQTEIIKKFFKIPLVIKNGVAKIDQPLLFEQPIAFNPSISTAFGQFAPSGAIREKDSTPNPAIKKVKPRVTLNPNVAKRVNIAVITFASLFILVFFGIGIFALIKGEDITTKIFGVLFMIFSVIMLYYSIIRGKIIQKKYNETIEKGSKTLATSFEIINLTSSNSNRIGARIYNVKFKFIDDFGKERKCIDNLRNIPAYYFEAYNIEKLPIKVYNSFAIIDFEELLKYQEEDIEKNG